MSTNHDIDGAVRYALPDQLEFGLRHKSGCLPNNNGIPSETLGERLEVLPCKQCRGHHYRNLLSSKSRCKGRTQCDFRFSKAHIATEQAIHRFSRGQIVKHRIDRTDLVFSFFIRKSRTEFIIERLRSDQFRRVVQQSGCSNFD